MCVFLDKFKKKWEDVDDLYCIFWNTVYQMILDTKKISMVLEKYATPNAVWISI